MLNPVFRREVRTVLRTWKTFIATTVYVLCLTGIVGLVLLSLLSNMTYNGFNPQSSTTMYSVMCGFQLGLIVLIVPALTGGAISGERERQTFDLMLVTRMSTFSIIAGKLASSLLVVILMIVATLPVFGVILYYGGVNLVHLLAMSLFFLVSAALIGSISILFSALFKRTVVAIIVTYLVIIALSLGTLFVILIITQFSHAFYIPIEIGIVGIYGILSVNPFLGFISVIDSQLGSSIVMDMIDSMAWSFSSVSSTPPMPITLPLWVANMIFDVTVIALLLTLASRIIRPAKRSKMYK